MTAKIINFDKTPEQIEWALNKVLEKCKENRLTYVVILGQFEDGGLLRARGGKYYDHPFTIAGYLNATAQKIVMEYDEELTERDEFDDG